MSDRWGPTSRKRVLLGVQGWLWPEWERNFYPEDMPEEWRLAFYNTQFNCVFLPADQWHEASREQLNQWQEDTQETFLFLLESGPEMKVPGPLQDKALCLTAQDERITWFDGQTDVRSLAESLKKVREGPRFLLSRDGDLSELERVRTLLGLLGLMA